MIPVMMMMTEDQVVTLLLVVVRMVAALPSHHQVSTGCYTGVWGHVYLYGIANIPEEVVCRGIRYVSEMATHSSEYSYVGVE